jgi:pimeloyl-ACP methyl ester carboxylesterase
MAAGALLLFIFIVFPVGYSYIYTHTGRTATTPDLRVPYERVTITTSDSLRLTGSYVPSRNRAAVILFPGATRSAEARMLVRHSYGVLLLDPRGQGRSQGDTIRWAGDRDLLGAVDYLRTRADVDPDRIGGFGFSVGGEILLEAAAQSTGLKAVVSEGAGIRLGEGLEKKDGVSGVERLLWGSMSRVMTAAATVFSNHGPPPPIPDRIGLIAPRSVLLIYADPGMGGESSRQAGFYAAAQQPKTIWEVPGAKHTGGIDAQPAEYERRVTAFFDRALLDSGSRR